MSDKGKEGKDVFCNTKCNMIFFILDYIIIYILIIHIIFGNKMNLLIILELIDFKARRVSTFNKNLLELAEWEIKHAQVTTYF